MPSKRPNDDETTKIPRVLDDTTSIEAIGDETMIVDPTQPGEEADNEIVFDADGNIPCDEPPGWRAPTTEQEMAAYLVWSAQHKTVARPEKVHLGDNEIENIDPEGHRFSDTAQYRQSRMCH